MDGGAWPFLVGGVICLVNSDNERDSSLLNNMRNQFLPRYFLMGSSVFNALKQSNNRSDALRCSGLHARYIEEQSEPSGF